MGGSRRRHSKRMGGRKTRHTRRHSRRMGGRRHMKRGGQQTAFCLTPVPFNVPGQGPDSPAPSAASPAPSAGPQ